MLFLNFSIYQYILYERGNKIADDSRTDKFTWKEGDLEEIKIFFVWYDPDTELWSYAKKITVEDHNRSGIHASQQGSIDKEFLGIPVSELRNGAYDQHGNRIPDDDPILSA